MEYRAIIAGRLEFANPRSVQQAAKVIDHLQETRYKGEALFSDSSFLDEELCALVMPRLVKACSEKVWQNTVHMLQQANAYAIAGDLNLWKIQEGHLEEHYNIEPISEKTAVMAYKRGLDLLADGQLDEARTSFTKAIKKFSRHAKAFERRAYTYALQGDVEAALEDIQHSIDIDPKRPEAYLSRAKLNIQQENWETAIEDLEMCMKRSIPHQSINLEARHRRGICLVALGQFDAAIKEYDFFLRRKLTKDHPQSSYLRQVAFDKGQALAAQENYEAAIEAFDQALKLPGLDGKPEQAEILLHRGLAFQKNGQTGFIEDWKQAADFGSTRAAELLAEVN